MQLNDICIFRRKNMSYFNKQIHYEKIIELLCNYKKIDRSKLIEILKDEECKYILFLLLNKYNCMDNENIYIDFKIKDRNNMYEIFKIAEKKLMINKNIREMFFEAETIMKKIE
ncbi:ribose-5-phosphate isomerase [Clostridium tetani]|nr:ribose-5-phosphate isomerase [Clostridium tetani]RYU99526.1 ribose-5-phosphate isomerase [Clostridium tetani]